MKNNKEIEFAKAFNESKKRAKAEIKQCYYPGCSEKSINSHILQQNGILSILEQDGHLYRQEVDQFKKPPIFFKRRGIGEVFSFNCFCEKHDNELFKEIEGKEIDLSIYRNRVLFTLRTLLNEKNRKQINIRQRQILASTHPDIYLERSMDEWDKQERLGLRDLEKTENLIWNDLFSNQETFIFNVRNIEQKPICLSAYYTYDTSDEIEKYTLINGKEKDVLIDIFISLFPYNGKSYLIMAYEKIFERVVKAYVNSYFKENEKRTERKLTNLLLFQCETWVCSETFYNTQIKPSENLFFEADNISFRNNNERRNYDLNIFSSDFKDKFYAWFKQNAG